MNTLDTVNYYPNLLILQYLGKPKAYATIKLLARTILMPKETVQVLSFPTPILSGSYVLSYNGVTTAPIAHSALAVDIQEALREIEGLELITVSGEGADGIFTINFVGVIPPAEMIEVVSSTMVDPDNVPIYPTIVETDETLPLSVLNGFNLVPGTPTAVGKQLDTLGKYVGVTRSVRGLTTPILLSDADFYTLIQMAIVRNSAQSSLAAIQEFLYRFFPGLIQVFDYQDMTLSYFISSSIVSRDLLQALVTANLLPKPMAVRITAIIYAPTVDNFFGFRTYTTPAYNVSPFNSYADYHYDYAWLSYAFLISF